MNNNIKLESLEYNFALLWRKDCDTIHATCIKGAVNVIFIGHNVSQFENYLGKNVHEMNGPRNRSTLQIKICFHKIFFHLKIMEDASSEI